jgi:hypothetical protein
MHSRQAEHGVRLYRWLEHIDKHNDWRTAHSANHYNHGCAQRPAKADAHRPLQWRPLRPAPQRPMNACIIAGTSSLAQRLTCAPNMSAATCSGQYERMSRYCLIFTSAARLTGTGHRAAIAALRSRNCATALRRGARCRNSAAADQHGGAAADS